MARPPSQPKSRPRVAAIAACLVLLASLADAQELSDSEFFGRSPELARRLESPVTLAWQGVPLRNAAQRIASTHKLALWIDRRADPGQPIALDVSQAPLGEVCDQIAAETGLAWVAYGPVVYFGPAPQTAELRTLRALARERLTELPADKRQAWLRPQPLALKRLSEPRSVVERLAGTLGVRAKNLEAIPHDIWPACELPAMAPADQLTLLLAGFDLTWRLDTEGATLEVVPIARPVVVERRVPRATQSDRLGKIVANDKSATSHVKQGSTYLVARVEQHEQLVDRPQAKPQRERPARPGETQVYSLTIREQPLEGLLRQLTEKLGLKLELSPELGSQKLASRVSFSVSEVPVDGLFAEIGKAAGVAIDVTDGAVRVSPAE